MIFSRARFDGVSWRQGDRLEFRTHHLELPTIGRALAFNLKAESVLVEFSDGRPNTWIEPRFLRRVDTTRSPLVVS